MFSIRKLLVASPVMMNWEERYSDTRDVETFRGHDSARGVVLPYKSDRVLVVPS